MLKKEKLPQNKRKKIIKNLEFLYGKKEALSIYKEIEKIIFRYQKKLKKERFKRNYFSEKDVILIVYGDNIVKKKEPSLLTLKKFLKNIKNYINIVHIIGLFLYSSDRGFSIIDFKKINPRLGKFTHLKKIKKDFSLLVDFVCNHISSKSEWFKKFAKGHKEYKNFFIAFDKKPPQKEIECVYRPRTTSLLVYRKLPIGKKWIWRTFCHDQIDLNYQNPKVLFKMVDVLLHYVENGAKFIRLDAIGYVWKKLGTSCFLTKESHIFVQLLRNILDTIAPGVSLIAEVNVNFKENINYLKANEAQLIYNFPLSSLLLFTFYQKNTRKILKFLDTINFTSKTKNIINILDCHDGISVVGAEDILKREEIEKIKKEVIKKGGKINYKIEKGRKLPYEFNITWWSALEDKEKPEILNIKKYIASRAIQFSIKGIPAIYFLGLFGKENCLSCFKKTGKTRDINRKRFTENQIKRFISNPKRKENKVFNEILRLLKYRNKEKAFHPAGNQKSLFLDKKVFSIIRTSPNKREKILVLVNISDENIYLKVKQNKIGAKKEYLFNILDRTVYLAENGEFNIVLCPYQVLWLKY